MSPHLKIRHTLLHPLPKMEGRWLLLLFLHGVHMSFQGNSLNGLHQTDRQMPENQVLRLLYKGHDLLHNVRKTIFDNFRHTHRHTHYASDPHICHHKTVLHLVRNLQNQPSFHEFLHPDVPSIVHAVDPFPSDV